MTTVVLNTVTRKVEVFSSARDVQARAEIADHKAAADPHPQYLADADLAQVALSGDAGDLIAGTVPDARMPNWTGYSGASRTALEAANVPAAVVGLRLLGHAAVGDGGGAHYKRVASEPAHPHKIQSADGAWWEELFAVDVTVSVPSDFATLQDAIDRLSKQPVRRGARIIVNIESGHALTAGVSVEHGDYGHFTIKSVDATVPLDASFPATDSVVRGNNARMPVLDCLVDAGGKGYCGYEATFGSTGIAWGGVINAGVLANPEPSGTGLRVSHGSKVVASSSNFSGATRRCAWITRGSTMIGDNANFSNAGGAALYVSRGSIVHANGANFPGATLVNSDASSGAVRVARSIASIRQSTINDSAGAGIWAFEGSIVAARLCTINNAATHGVETFQGGAFVDVNGATINDSGENAINVDDGGKVVADDATIRRSGTSAIFVRSGGEVHAHGATIDAESIVGGGSGCESRYGGQMYLRAASILNSTVHGVRVADGGIAHLSNATITGSAFKDISIARGSHVNAIGATTSTSGTSGNSPDINDTNKASFNAIDANGILYA